MSLTTASFRRSALALGALVLGLGVVAPASAAPGCAAGDSAICFFLNDVKATPAQMGIPATTASLRRDTCEDWPSLLGARREFRGPCTDTVAYEAPAAVVDLPTPPTPISTEINLNDLLR